MSANPMGLTSFARRHLPVPLRQALGRVRNAPNARRTRVYRDLLGRISAGDVLVQSENLRGEFWLDVRSHLLRRIAVYGKYEPEVAAALVSHADRDFIDIGANVGFFAIHMALQPNGPQRILAVEPNPRAIAYLERNVQHNGVSSRVEVVRYAVAAESQELELTAFEGREEYSTISTMVHPSVKDLGATSYKVSAAPLDLILQDRSLDPGLIKVDAEGAELEVLQGMESTLKRYRPVLICEIGGSTFGSDVAAIDAQFKKMKYDIYGLDGRPLKLDPSIGGEIIARPAD